MSTVIDASALIAFLRDEPGADVVENVLSDIGGLKAEHRRVSLADCCALALARRLGARLVTADRHEFEPILSAGISQIEFIR